MNQVKDVIHVSQHGFMAGRSCHTNLVDFTSFIAKELEKPDIKQVDVIYNDLSSAFVKGRFDVLLWVSSTLV